MDKVYLTVVMPALNEEENIVAACGETLKAFAALGVRGEVVIVDDGSSDGTGRLAEGLAEKEGGRVRVLRHSSPQGIGASFWDGVDAAAGGIVTMFPGDNENEPMEALRYLRLLDDVDMIVPFVFNKKARSGLRNGLSCLYRLIINLTFGTSFNYTNGTVLYRKCVLAGVGRRDPGFFYQTGILIRLAKQGYLFAEVPYSLGTRSGGRSKAVSLRSFLKVAEGYLRLACDIWLKGPAAGGAFHPDSVSAKRYGNYGRSDT